jgi:molybdopterin synthase catalytic subunit
MRVNVRYFAVVRERLRRDEEVLELPPGADVGAALDALSSRHEAVRGLRPYLRAAVNQETVGDDHALADGDELALIPPVAGGDDRPRLARIVDGRAPSLDAVVAAVRAAGCGGIATFTGLVRDRSHGRAVERLEYEAYAAMAEKVFVALCEELERELPGVRLAVEHRTGKLAVGDVAVVIAAAAPHRGEAFQACQAMIDRLKERAPIWKKEIGPDGSSWVGLGP